MKASTEILLSAAFVLTPEENYTRYVSARNESNEEVNPDNDAAIKWCVIGVMTACMYFGHLGMVKAMDALEAAIGTPNFGCWNDSHSHAEVLDALYKAAELAETS